MSVERMSHLIIVKACDVQNRWQLKPEKCYAIKTNNAHTVSSVFRQCHVNILLPVLFAIKVLTVIII